jgi:hypothetical protein
MRSATSRQISSTNILRQYHQHSSFYDVLPSSPATNKPISLPFTYCQDSPIGQARTNYEKISAWLNHTDDLKKTSHDDLRRPLKNANRQQLISSSSVDNHGKRHVRIFFVGHRRNRKQST